jgi:hypothetical protein
MADAGKDYLAIIAEADRFKLFGEADETKTCLNALEAQFIERWAATDKPEIAHELWHRVRAVRQVRQEIQSRVDAGRLAQAEMKRDGDYQKAQQAGRSPSRSKRKAS